MKFSTIGYFISDAFKSLKRNRTISIASIATVLTTLFIFGAFLLTALNVKNGVTDVQDKVEVKVFLKDDVTQEQRDAVEAKLKTVQGVKEVEFESKDQAFAKMEGSSDYNKEILAGYSKENNPLPASYIVRLTDPSYAESISEAVQDLPGVESIGNQQDVINQIHGIVKVVRVVGIVLFIILIGVSIFLIMNTTKLTVYSRRREVGIMKFVGATDWFIRWPFIIEGMVIGLSGALLSCIALFFAYNGVFSLLAKELAFVSLVPASYVLTTIIWQFTIGGLLIGGIASGLSLRKFLVV